MSRIDDLYAKYLQPLLRTLRRNPDAEDIVQETLIATWKRLEHIPPEHEWAYLVTAAYNLERKRFRRANAPRRGGGLVVTLEGEHDAPDRSPSPEAELLTREEIAQFRARFPEAMAALGPETQQCLALRRRGLGSKEIAQHLPSLTDQAVRTRLSRAAHLLAKLLGDQADDHHR